MSNPPPSRKGSGSPSVPSFLLPQPERIQREKAALADIEARLAAGTLSPEDADEEILELAVQRFGFLPDDALEELREVGRLLNDEPEMVESRALAPRPRGEDC